MSQTKSLYEYLMQRAYSSRREGFLLFQVSGWGAVVMTDQSFLQAMRWAQMKPSSGNLQRDLDLFLDRIETLIPRFGTSVAAKGSPKTLTQLAQAMAVGGLDMLEWGIPPQVKKAVEEERAMLQRTLVGVKLPTPEKPQEPESK